MPAKREVPDASDLVALYQSGAAMRQLLKERGISDCMFSRLLRDHGVERRSPQDAYRIKRGRPMENARWSPEDPASLVSRYVGGESLKAISDNLGTSRQAIGDWLKRHGVTLRGKSEAETLKWSVMKEDRQAVERQCQAAWEGTKRRRVTHLDEKLTKMLYQGGSRKEIANTVGMSEPFVKKRLKELGNDLQHGRRERRARGVQLFVPKSNSYMVSHVERTILAALHAIGINPIHQFACGPYNLDMAFEVERVAIEIERSTISASKSLRRERIEYLFDREWSLLVVYIPKRTIRTHNGRASAPVDAALIAKKIVTFLELARLDPALAGQYGVINRNGQPAAMRRDYFHGAPRVPGF